MTMSYSSDAVLRDVSTRPAEDGFDFESDPGVVTIRKRLRETLRNVPRVTLDPGFGDGSALG